MDTTRLEKESGTDVAGGARDARFTFTDFFAGIGGFRIGLEALGGKCVYSVEYDKFARQTYAEWFGAPPEGNDIREIDAAAIPAHVIMGGGFPCQGFSLAGVSKKNSLGVPHGFDDKRHGYAFFKLAETVAVVRPMAILLENVKNLRSHDKGNTWRVIRTTLEDLGYKVFVDVLDAQFFGVPQRRQRLFVVAFDGSRMPGPIDFCFPKFGAGSRRLIDVLDAEPDPAMTISEKAMRGHEKHAARHKEKGNGFNFKLVDVQKVGPTLPAHYAKGGKEILIPQIGIMPRKLSPREAARYMGFPDHLAIVVSPTQAYRQFGNAVVPAIIEAVGEEVLKVLERHPVAAQLD